jgi:hypothetical protein
MNVCEPWFANDHRLATIDRRLPTPTDARKGYNSAVNSPAPPKPASDNKHQHRHSIYAAEATGLLVIAVLLLVLTIIRYWRYIPWSAR